MEKQCRMNKIFSKKIRMEIFVSRSVGWWTMFVKSIGLDKIDSIRL